MVNGVEMRVGVWVYFEDDPKPMQYVPVWDFEDLNPIPLTDEWFIKFGFTFKSDQYWDKENSEIEILIRKDKDQFFFDWETDWGANNSIEIKYVHQLENLCYDLTGKQLVDVHLPHHNRT